MQPLLSALTLTLGGLQHNHSVQFRTEMSVFSYAAVKELWAGFELLQQHGRCLPPSADPEPPSERKTETLMSSVCHFCIWKCTSSGQCVVVEVYLDHQPRLGWKTRALPTASNQLQEASLCLVNDFGQLTSCL